MLTPEQRDQIESKLNRYFAIDGTYEIDDQGLVSVAGSVALRLNTFTRMPVHFDVVSGNFQMDRCGLKTLQGFPRRVAGHVSIARTKVSSLWGGPELVGGSFWAYGCLLKNLVGAPRQVLQQFVVYNNDLNSYDHIPQGCSNVTLPYNPTLGVLRLLQYPKVEFVAQFGSGAMRQALLLTDIVNKYTGSNSPGDILSCRDELADAGFEGNAEW